MIKLNQFWRRRTLPEHLIETRDEKVRLIERQRHVRAVVKALEERAKVLIREP